MLRLNEIRPHSISERARRGYCGADAHPDSTAFTEIDSDHCQQLTIHPDTAGFADNAAEYGIIRGSKKR